MIEIRWWVLVLLCVTMVGIGGAVEGEIIGPVGCERRAVYYLTYLRSKDSSWHWYPEDFARVICHR